MVVLPPLPFPVGSIIVVAGVEMERYYRHVLTKVVRVLLEVLPRQLCLLALVLPDIGRSMAVGIVLCELAVVSQVLQIVPLFSQRVVLISGGRIP